MKAYSEMIIPIVGNDREAAVKILERFGLSRGQPKAVFDSTAKVAKAMLSYASAKEYIGALDDDLSGELLEHTAMLVDLLPFLGLVTAITNATAKDFGAIAEEVCFAISRNIYSERAAEAIEELDEVALRTLLSYIDSEVKGLDPKFRLPILRRIYATRLIPTELMFAYMSLCIYDHYKYK